MQYVASWRHRTAEAIRILSQSTPTYYKIFWLKAQSKAMFCKLREVLTHDQSLRDRLCYKRLWYHGIYSEVDWWRVWLATKEGQKWLAGMQNPQCPLQDETVSTLIQELADHSIKILDVGAGPVTHLGYNYPGKRLEITSIDPLADAYARVLRDFQVSLPVETRTGYGELLLDVFDRETFDIAYASNSLDHSSDPLLIIDNMLELVKHDRYVVLRHYRNEGETGAYYGLHQWNFDVEGDDFLIWNTSRRHNITEILAERAHVKCWIADTRSHGVFDYSDWVVSVIKKF